MADNPKLLPPPNFRWIVNGQLAGSARPSRPEHIDWLAHEGVGAVVSTTRMADELQLQALEAGMEYLYLPVEDFSVPTPSQIKRFTAFVRENLAGRRAVLVHCGAGIGRTGTLCSLWLVSNGVSATEAIDRVGVETSDQRKLVMEWENTVLSGEDD